MRLKKSLFRKKVLIQAVLILKLFNINIFDLPSPCHKYYKVTALFSKDGYIIKV